MLELELRTLLLISMQRALLGNITPSIRAIAIRFKGQEELTVIFYFDRFPTQEDKDIVSDTVGEVLGDIEFSKVNELCQYSKEPLSSLSSLDAWVYMRNETIN
jgi:hypothetical protein